MINILSVIFFTLTILLTIICFVLIAKIKKLSKKYYKLFLENAVMQEYIDIVKSKETDLVSDELVDKENFIRFLSDSRDWAFTYIEDVQNGLKEFIDAVDPDLNHFSEYGEVGSAYPHYDSMVRINNAYKRLKELMPVEEETKE